MLLGSGADPHASTADGFTPLLFAAHNGDVETAETLFAAGVDVNETGADGTHVLPYAIVTGQDQFALFLLEQGADPDGAMGGVRALHAAAGSVGTWLGDWKRRHGDSRRRSEFGSRGLDASRGLAVVKTLLARGADPNARITTSAMFQAYIGYPTKRGVRDVLLRHGRHSGRDAALGRGLRIEPPRQPGDRAGAARGWRRPAPSNRRRHNAIDGGRWARFLHV